MCGSERGGSPPTRQRGALSEGPRLELQGSSCRVGKAWGRRTCLHSELALREPVRAVVVWGLNTPSTKLPDQTRRPAKPHVRNSSRGRPGRLSGSCGGRPPLDQDGSPRREGAASGDVHQVRASRRPDVPLPRRRECSGPKRPWPRLHTAWLHQASVSRGRDPVWISRGGRLPRQPWRSPPACGGKECRRFTNDPLARDR